MAASPLRAAEVSPQDTEEPKKPLAVDLYMTRLDDKFDKGALNFIVGWTEIVNQPRLRLKNEEKKNKGLKFAGGLGQGILFAIADTAGGFLNAASSPLPQFEIPLPQDGVQLEKLTGGKPVDYNLTPEPVPGASLSSKIVR